MSLADTATRLLTDLGEAVTLTYTSGEQRDPATGEIISAGSETTVNGFGYTGSYRLADVDGTVVQSGDVRLVLNKVDERPEIGWSANVDGRDFRVMDVRPLKKSGADVAYICQLRV